MTVILGIDPGLTGALAWLHPDGTLEDVLDMPVLDGVVSAELLLDLVWHEEGTVAVLEWPGIMPKNGAKAARSMGMSLGTITTWLAAQGVPTHRITPGVWKRQLGLTADKERSRALAIRQWPDHADSFKRKKDDGRAEAALLAWWWLTKGAGATIGRTA